MHRRVTLAEEDGLGDISVWVRIRIVRYIADLSDDIVGLPLVPGKSLE